MRIDLSGRGWSGDVAPDALENAAAEIRIPFVELVSRLSTEREGDLDWWVTPLASRNTYACSLHIRLCRAVLARQLLMAGGVDEVLVDSPALAQVVSSVADRSIRVSMVGVSRWTRILKPLRNYAGALYHAICQYVFSHLLLKYASLPDGPVVLVDTFLYANSINGRHAHDRHYPSLIDLLDDEERKQVYYIPTYYGVYNYFRFFLELREVRNKFVLKEDVLRLGDYLYALAHPFRLHWPKGPIDFLGMDVAPLVRESMLESFATSAAIEGLLRYRATCRMKERGLTPRRIIDWFENQEIDHGANAGWRQFFPEVELVGYQGFLASRHYFCMFPTALEHRFNLLPNRVTVIGPALINAVKEFCPEIEVETAPAFRFQSVWLQREVEPDANWFTILLALPILKNEAYSIVEMAISAAAKQADLSWRFHIKPHPTWSTDDIKKLSKILPSNFRAISGDFDQCVERSNVLVGTASSTCVHAMVLGIPVVIAAQPGCLVQNPIPEESDKDMWMVCYTPLDLAHALHGYAHSDLRTRQRRCELGGILREMLFEPVTGESVRSFLGFDVR